ncbi:MAG TPA: Fis family transcriptional regulator [Myxococcaceae bacterium]|nr:Fis family transcriptional regulator [Myxococcaceae bacterium]
MTYRGYSEPDLVTNRSSLFLYGGSPTDRRAWAMEAQQSFAAEGPLVEVSSPEQLAPALAMKGGVVFLPDAPALGLEAQGQILRCLQQQEERPKVVLGMQRRPVDLRDAGSLRDDLLYRLQNAVVDLGVEDVAQKIRARRQKRAPGAGAKKPAAKAARKRSPPAPKSSKKKRR